MKNVKLIYGLSTLFYSSREYALSAARRIAKKENGLSFELRINTGDKTERIECYTYDCEGIRC